MLHRSRSRLSRSRICCLINVTASTSVSTSMPSCNSLSRFPRIPPGCRRDSPSFVTSVHPYFRALNTISISFFSFWVVAPLGNRILSIVFRSSMSSGRLLVIVKMYLYAFLARALLPCAASSYAGCAIIILITLSLCHLSRVFMFWSRPLELMRFASI